MHPIDIEATMKTMKIYVDTRERPTDQAKRRYSSFGVPWEYRKLNFGDYSCEITLPNGCVVSFENIVCVERKFDISELCMCYTRERGRFKREFERAASKQAKVILLIENASWEAVYAGRYRSQMKPQALVASMLAWLARYNCQLIFCKAETSGRLIHDILYREAKERLERGDFDDPLSSQPVP